MTSLEKKLRRKLRELDYCLKVSPAQREGTATGIGADYGGYQISDGNHVVAGWWYDLTLRDVENWVSDRERNIEWMISGGGCE